MRKNAVYKRTARKRTFRRRNTVKKTFKRMPMVKTVKSIVKKALDRRIENKKIVSSSSLAILQASSATITATSAVDITPFINQGITESGRIGNSVRMKSGYLKGFLRYNSTGTNGVTPTYPSQYHIRIFIGRLKDTMGFPSSLDFGNLLRSGSTTYPFDSYSGLSLIRRVNKEAWTIYYDKIFKLGAANHSTGVATYTTTNGIANNDYRLNYIIKIPLTKMLKKTLIFNDASSTPQNEGLFMFAGAVDCLASDSLPPLPVALMDFDIEYSYEDA